MNKIAMYKEEIMKEASQKRDDAKREKDLETRMWRDRVKPELKRGFKAFPATLGGSIAGGVAGTVLSGGNPKVGQLGGLAGGSVASYKSKRKQERKELDRLSNKYLGKDATKEQHNTVKNKRLGATVLNAIPGAGAVGMVVSNTKTPESVIQKARREKAYNGSEKQASTYLEEIMKEASARKEYNKAVDEFNKKILDMDYQEALNATHNVNRRAEKKYPREEYLKERRTKMLKGAIPGVATGAAATLLSKADNKVLAGSLGLTAAAVGSAIGAGKTDKKYIKNKTEAVREEIDSHNKTIKKASVYLDELMKEAGYKKKDLI